MGVHMNHLGLPMGTCTAKQRDGLVSPFLATGSSLGRGWYFSFDQVDSWSQVQEGKGWKLRGGPVPDQKAEGVLAYKPLKGAFHYFQKRKGEGLFC